MGEQDQSKDKELLSALDKAYDRQRDFMDNIEQMRWKLTSALGIGAFAAFLIKAFSQTGKSATPTTSHELIIATTAIVLVICIAGIISQIRILQLFGQSWRKMVAIQKKEISIRNLNQELPEITSDNYLVIPEPFENPSTYSKFVTIHSANCLVFTALFCASTAICVEEFSKGWLWPTLTAGISFFALTIWSLLAFNDSMTGKTDAKTIISSDNEA